MLKGPLMYFPSTSITGRSQSERSSETSWLSESTGLMNPSGFEASAVPHEMTLDPAVTERPSARSRVAYASPSFMATSYPLSAREMELVSSPLIVRGPVA
jgi:hypothetical protein